MRLILALVKFLKELKTPWTFAVVSMATGAACYLTINPSLNIPGAAYQFSAILIGGFIAKSLIAISIGAMKTMLLMIGCSLLLIIVTISFTDVNVFKDSAIQGLLNVTGGGLVIVVGELLNRHKP